MHVQLESLEGRRLLAFSLGVAGELAGSTGDANLTVSDVAADYAGNVYVTGRFTGSVDFDIRAKSSYVLQAQGTGVNVVAAIDGFVAKYTAGGSLVWARQIQLDGDVTTPSVVSMGKLALDDAGNVLVSGSFSGTVDFNPRRGKFNMTAAGPNDAFVWKLNSDGWIVWAQRLDNLRPDPRGATGNDVVVDAGGDVVVTGGYYSESELPEGRGYVARLNGQTGEVAYNKFLPGDAIAGYSIAADWEGHVLVVGRQVVGGESRQTFVAKVNRRGNGVWYTELSGETRESSSLGIAVSKQGAVYVAGTFRGTGTWGSTSIAAVGDQDAYLSKLDASGGVLWTRAWGGVDTGAEDSADDVVLDANENAIVGGRFIGDIDFDRGPGTVQLNAGATADAYVAKIDSTGAFVRVSNFGGRGRAHPGVAVAWSRRGGVFVGGTYSKTLDVDPGAGEFVLTGESDRNGFLVRLIDA